MKAYNLAGGAVVSGSFQAFDQSYLLAALGRLGPRFVGVTQLPITVSDTDVERLDRAGVRAVRFNVKRGGSEALGHLEALAKRVHDIARWHVELYIDSKDLTGTHHTITRLPSVSIDHLGLSGIGFKSLINLVEKGVRVKATGFGRIDFDAKEAIRTIASANPDALMFGTDLPSTRAPRPYLDEDLLLIQDVLDETQARKVCYDNAAAFYRLNARS
jgi:predicted TIM-barrel fold metal-dependent hydrolase